MAEAQRLSSEVLSLPLVAYRGLWDRFAAPDSPDAVRRAYRRGVPSVVRVGQRGLSVGEAVALVSDPVVNPHARPVYLMVEQLPMLTDLGPDCGPLVRAVVASVEPECPRPILSWSSTGWMAIGSYIPRANEGDEVSSRLSRAFREDPALVLFESSNVDADPASHGGREDESTLTALRALGGPQVRLRRVSDLVELDQLDRQKVEAA